jgi:hypothetical protein
MWICDRCGTHDVGSDRRAYRNGWLRVIGHHKLWLLCPGCAPLVLDLLRLKHK